MIIFMAIIAIPASAYDFQVGGIYYNYDGSTCAKVTYKNDIGNSYEGDIVIPSEVTYLGCTYKVSTIGFHAFANCPNLSFVEIPNSVTTIEEGAFEYCKNLSGIEIPNSVTTIKGYAFEQCDNLVSVTIPNSVTIIDAHIFDGCDGLKSVIIPNSVTKIRNYAFAGCENLTSLMVMAEIPPDCVENSFIEVSRTHCRLQVPKGSLSYYKTFPIWSEFYFISEIENDAIDELSCDSGKISTCNGAINIENLPKGTAVKIYQLNGTQIFDTVTDSESINYQTYSPGNYIVLIGNQSYKIHVK